MAKKDASNQKNTPKPKKKADKSNTGVLITVAVIGATATILAAVISSLIPLLAESATPAAGTASTAEAIPQTPNPIPPTDSPSATEAIVESTSTPVETIDDRGVPMILVPEGGFMMGSNHGEINEQPVHEVILASFYIDKYEVTNAQYRACVSLKACDPPGDDVYYQNAKYTDHPVTFVNWYMAKTYCEWREARLPTEAEWEKAARGTNEVAYPWGNTIDCSFANYRGENGHCVGDSSPVGSYESGLSMYGIHDLAGNALEWVSSVYADYPYNPNDGREGLNVGNLRVIRGGSWNNREGELRTTTRAWASPSSGEFDYGFRCARDTQ